MVLARRVSHPYLKKAYDIVYEVPFVESLKLHLKEPLIFEEVFLLYSVL